MKCLHQESNRQGIGLNLSFNLISVVTFALVVGPPWPQMPHTEEATQSVCSQHTKVSGPPIHHHTHPSVLCKGLEISWRKGGQKIWPLRPTGNKPL